MAQLHARWACAKQFYYDFNRCSMLSMRGDAPPSTGIFLLSFSPLSSPLIFFGWTFVGVFEHGNFTQFDSPTNRIHRECVWTWCVKKTRCASTAITSVVKSVVRLYFCDSFFIFSILKRFNGGFWTAERHKSLSHHFPKCIFRAFQLEK